MKKSLVLMAMAGVALAGCVNDVAEVAQKEQKDVKIAFDTPVLYNNAESRANFYGEIGGHIYDGSTTVYTYPKAENFVIYAVSHTGDFAGWTSATTHEMNDKTVVFDQSVDGWAPKTSDNHYYYWPEGKMSFAASSPADLELTGATRSYGATGLTIRDFEIQQNAEKHYDLLFSDRVVNKTKDDMLHGANYYSGIPINFRHALSSVRFSIKNETEALIVLKEIRLGGVKYKGNFTENLNETTSSSVPEWTLSDDLNTTGTMDVTKGYVGFTGSVGFPAEAQYVASLAVTDDDSDGITDKTNQLLLMPQMLTENAELYVGYTVNGQPHSKVAKIKGLKDVGNNEVHEWVMGTRYTYRLVYTSSTAAKDKIYFAPGTGAWIEHDVIVVNL